jgi:hypothetical protein
LFFRWLYSYFLAVNGNFRLRLKNHGINDPEIGSRWSYFVENPPYTECISQNTVQTEVSPLVLLVAANFLTGSKAIGCELDFHAVNKANSKSSKYYIASGVVVCVCARHSLMQKNRVGDLQLGERYVLSDPSSSTIINCHAGISTQIILLHPY